MALQGKDNETMRNGRRDPAARRAGGRARALRCLAAALAAACLGAPSLFAARPDEGVTGRIAIISIPQPTIQMTALSERCAEAVGDAFNRMGRFLPLDPEVVRRSLESLPPGAGDDALERAGLRMKADLVALITLEMTGTTAYGTVTLVPITEPYRHLRKSASVRSRVLMNMPLKLARETARFHRDLPVEVRVLGRRDGLAVLNVGQWHGLTPGRYRTAGGIPFTITRTGRYRSLAILPGTLEANTRFLIDVRPPWKAFVRELTERIEYITYYRYNLATSGQGTPDPEKALVDGICVLNPGANILVPGYGSYLATTRLGFKKPSPSIPGVIFSTTLVIAHFLVPEAVGHFKINFFPGVMDSDKTVAMNRLQIFLWSTLPVTVSAAYMDQVAHLCKINETLPPFFMHKNVSALALSTVIPGGGLFYKGHRLAGWGFYLSEMSLAAFCVYGMDNRKHLLWGGVALGGVKLLDLLTALLAPPSYEVHGIEREGEIRPGSLSMDIVPAPGGDLVSRLGYRFTF